MKTKQGENGVETNMVKRFYRTRHRRINGQDVDMDIVYQMFMRAFHSEYELIQNSLTTGKIDAALAEKLQTRISTDEMTYLQNMELFRGLVCDKTRVDRGAKNSVRTRPVRLRALGE